MNTVSTTLSRLIITEVTTVDHERIFLEMPDAIYKGDANYVRPLDKDLKAIFDARLNPLLGAGKGQCRRWLAWSAAGRS
jgi:hypothetical protein